MANKKKRKPRRETERARKVLAQARDSVEGFFKAFDTVRTARKAKGNPTDEEQDLLRASLVFAAAGLDSVAKELIKGSIRALAASDSDVQRGLETFVQRHLRGDSGDSDSISGTRFLSSVLIAASPQDRLIDLYVLELTGSSLQSPDQLMRTAKALGLNPGDAKVDPKQLKPIFDIRNSIIHELDVNLGPTRARRNQNSRRYRDMNKWSSMLLSIADELVAGVEAKLDEAS